MIDEKEVAKLIEGLRRGVEKRGNDVYTDVMELLSVAMAENGPAEEYAKTICEILEPERLGGLVCMACGGPFPSCACKSGSDFKC